MIKLILLFGTLGFSTGLWLDQGAGMPPHDIENELFFMKNTAEPDLKDPDMYPALSRYIESMPADMEKIDPERQAALREIADFIREKRQAGDEAHLIFICTHNSRRSHMAQIWAATAAAYYGVDTGVHTYSGGTEATAFNPRAVASMKRAGFQIDDPGGDNPSYRVKYSDIAEPLTCFSKKYDHPENPSGSFAAIMVCSDADDNCPFIPGAEMRMAIPYVDPKESDGTPVESDRYDERCRQIAAEMFYLMSQVK